MILKRAWIITLDKFWYVILCSETSMKRIVMFIPYCRKQVDPTTHEQWTCPAKQTFIANEQVRFFSERRKGICNQGNESSTGFRYKERCHIDTGTDSIIQQSTTTLVQALTVSYNRAQPHWYRHWQYHTREHFSICTGTHHITQQNITIMLQALTVSHNIILPHWYRHSQYYTTQHCHIGTGNHKITQQSTATLVQALKISHNRALLHWYRH